MTRNLQNTSLTTLWEERTVDGPWFKLKKRDLERLRHKFIWNRSQEAIEQRHLFK